MRERKYEGNLKEIFLFNGNEFTLNLLAIYFLKNHGIYFTERKYKGNLKEIFLFNGNEFTPNLLAIYFLKPPASFTFTERKYKGNHRGNLFCSTEMNLL